MATLHVPQDPVDPQLDRLIATYISDLLVVRQLQVHRKYQLQGPRVYQHEGGRRSVSIQVGATDIVVAGVQADAIIQDAAGNILRDTRTERIAEHARLLSSTTPKLARSATLRGLLTSYSRSVADPFNELVHLYEIRDGLSQHYGGEQPARAALSISATEWGRLGVLANVEPLEEGRHRGKHPAGRRSASAAELGQARAIIRRWITAFAETV
jgi:hypothetical protein